MNASPLTPHSCGQVENLAVDPLARKRGVGRSLLCALLARCGCDATPCELEVREHNAPAIALYASLGFQQVRLQRWCRRQHPPGAVNCTA